MGFKKMKARSVNASSWDKIDARDPGDTLANRDVFGDQQLDRSKPVRKRSRKAGLIWAGILGAAVSVAVWILYSLLMTVVVTLGASVSGVSFGGPGAESYYTQNQKVGEDGGSVTCYRPLTEQGTPNTEAPCYPTAEDVPVPGWYEGAEKVAQKDSQEAVSTSVGAQLGSVSGMKLYLSLGAGIVLALVMGTYVSRRVGTENVMNTTDDINQHLNDQHIALPEETQRQFDIFPDAGAHSDVQVSSVISHMMLKKKGLGNVDVVQRAESDIIDEDGEIVYYTGEVLEDESGNAKTKTEPLIDEAFGEDLFAASGLADIKGADGKPLRRFFDAGTIPYKPKAISRDKLGGYKTLADLIKDDWTFPEYEVQRPAGAYVVDTAPVNTMVLAITRGGKGQTYIEPTLDMWSRESKPSNMVINDPKGELLVRNYIPFVRRGFEPVQFNLINPTKTNIYNPLGMAADAAREGDSTKCAQYVENIADVFFPLDGGEDPVWPNAANNAFKRAAYGLIDYYLEEERELREFVASTDMPPEELEHRLDEMWGRVSLYNCYQLFVQLSSKKLKNPEAELEQRQKEGEFEEDPDGHAAAEEAAKAQSPLWEGKAEQDMLTLYFNATEQLPMNTMRTLIGNANNALRSMAGAEKMLASVYGIAITAMSFFTNPTISRLTSGRPSQTTDFGGLSFPRRVGVRFSQNFLTRDNLMRDVQAVWSAYSDSMFTENLGKDFEHEDVVSDEGWARYYFKGKFPTDEAYLKLELVSAGSQMLLRTFYFHFKKSYQLSLNGRHFVEEPVTGKKIIKDGFIRELKPIRAGGTADGEITAFKAANTVYPQDRLDLTGEIDEPVTTEARAITQTMVRYSEMPKAVFLVTPPHLQVYAKIVLILIKQLVDLNFDKSYMTKANQKPLYRTRFMLDELGNLQSEGTGISGFETMLSIGLGQEQQFTIILQTLQQLRDVYGESVDKIVQGNAQPMNALIATPEGWEKMGNMVVGDRVLTPFGTTTEVTGVYPKGLRPVYRVTLRDGSTTEACDEHLWSIDRWKSSITYLGGKDEAGKRRYVGGADGKTMERITEIVGTEDLKSRVDKGRQIDLPRIAPVVYPEADLSVDPYVLGAILGDGHVQSNGVVKFTCADPGTIEEIHRRGYVVVDDTVRGERKDGTGYRINGVNARMRDLAIAGKRSWEKSIPEQYLFGSVEQRIDLVRGLMDTDGTISDSGEMEFTSTSHELAEGVQTLIRSLGGRVAINVKDKVMYTSPNQVEPKQARPAHRVQNIRLPEINPFLLARKAERWRDRTRGFNRVVSVEYVRDDLVQCLRVADERHLYLTDDFIPTHNTSNIVYLKSTDDQMLETLEKMSGKTHRSYRNSKQVTQNMDKVIGGKTDGAVSYTTSTEQEALIGYNDMYFITPNNSIVFRAGDAPVWNRNETILPMAHRLLRNTITHGGRSEYTLQTIPTLSTAADFNVRSNQPDFVKMLNKRIRQAVRAGDAKKRYQEAYGFSDVEIERLDPDIYSDEVMEIITMMIAAEEGKDPNAASSIDPEDLSASMIFDEEAFIKDTELAAEVHDLLADEKERTRPIFAEKTVSRDQLVHRNGTAKLKTLDAQLTEAYKSAMVDMQRDHEHFSVGGDGELRSADGSKTYISPLRSGRYADAARQINGDIEDEEARVFAEQDITEEDLQSLMSVKIHSAFYQFLASLDTWEHLADGQFDRAMAIEMRLDETS